MTLKPVLIKADKDNLCQAEKLPDVNSKNPRSFATKINELNLLGANLDPEQENTKYTSSIPDSEFRIDQLNL